MSGPAAGSDGARDPRLIDTGWRIPGKRYCDQPYVVVNDDGSWMCVMTTGAGVEGERGQHVVATRSIDRGRTWSEPVALEPPDGPEASWAVPLRTAAGRIYVFYTCNTENLREVRADDPPYPGGVCRRVDSLGAFVYRFSDDGGRTWSARRWEIPVRPFSIDRENPYQGRVRFFWSVAKPFVDGGVTYLFASKVGGFGEGFFTRSEGMLLRSDNLAAEPDPDRHRWETLPHGEAGIRGPRGKIAEEHNGVPLGGSRLFCVYRTTDGFSGHAYSRDGGATWSGPAFMTYGPGQRRCKNPRAANFVRRFSNGRFLYWFHNHGREGIYDGQPGNVPYQSRNPAWVSGGIEEGGAIRWSEPEILLYADEPGVRMSYPDFIEDRGRYYVTETQKEIARVHEIDPTLLEGVWGGAKPPVDAVVRLDPASCRAGALVALPELPAFAARGGFTLELWIRPDSTDGGQSLFDSRDREGRGIHVTVEEGGVVSLAIGGRAWGVPGGTWSCGLMECSWTTDRGLLAPGALHHVVAIVDGGPRLILFVVDGRLCDGGDDRQFGWGRFPRELRDPNGAPHARVAPRLRGSVEGLQLYPRALRVAEAVASFHADPPR
jgi:hypothetical protein